MIWELLNRNIIKKESDPFLYAQIKECLIGKKKRYTEILKKLNWQVTITPEIIILKKATSQIDETMGIAEFKDKMDYVFLSAIYYYLNMNNDSVFTADDVIEHLKIIFEQENISADFESTRIKYCLYRAFTYCEKQGYLNKLDGDVSYLVEESSYMDGVLYFNTGYVREIEVLQEKETICHKVYRSLFLKPILYFNDFNVEMKHYIEKNMIEIEEDFKYILGSDINLICQSSFACLMIPNNAEIRNDRREICQEFPRGNMRDLLLTRMLTHLKQSLVKTGIHHSEINQYLTMEQYENIVGKMKREDRDWWTKEYQSMSIQQLVRITLRGLREWNAINYDEKVVTIYPLTSIIQGDLI